MKNGVYLWGQTNTHTMKATLTFPKREQAEGFAIAYQRHTKRGHIVGAGSANVEVIVFDLSDEDKEWIDGYVNRLNAIQAN